MVKSRKSERSVDDMTFIKEAPSGIRRSPRHIKSKPSLGVFGGSFNPITNAHLVLAEMALAAFKLCEIVFVLPEILPHKEITGASISDRIAMMQSALIAYDRFSIALSKHGLFLDIYHDIKRLYGSKTRIYFITGRDAAERILTWKYADPSQALSEMFSSFELIVANRGGQFLLSDDPQVRQHLNKVHLLEIPPDVENISSSLVRERVKQGHSIAGLVPDPVKEIIETKRLYC